MESAGCERQGENEKSAFIICVSLRAPVHNAVDLCMSSVSAQSDSRRVAKSLSQNRPQKGGQAHFASEIPDGHPGDGARPVPDSSGKGSKSHAVFALVAALILAVNVTAEEARQPDAVPVFHCAFGEDWDVNYDGWPDRWVRKTGLGYPHYVNMAIEDDATAVGHKCLQIDLDGAAAAVVSPPIRVMSRFSYVFDAQIKNTGLKHSTVVITLSFCDSTGRVLQTEKTEPLASTNGWRAVRLEQIEPRDRAIDRVVIGLQVLRGSKGDLRGHVSLADVRLGRLPRIDVSTNNACNVYTDLNGIEVKCALSGIREPNPEIYFQLLDGDNKELQRQHFPLKGQLIVDNPSRGAEVTEGGEGPQGYEGTIKWQPKIPDYGFYRMVVLMKSSKSGGGHGDVEQQLGGHTVDLVVVPPLTMPRRGEFGWTLPDGDRPLSFQDLSRLLPEVGINWVKVPLWFDANNPRRGDELIRFVELLGASNIDAVGIIDQPPGQAAAAAGRPHHTASIAEVLSQDSSVWSAALEPVMTRLSLRVRWWQLGGDYDTGFAGLPGLNKRIGDLRTALFRFGQDVRMGMSWDWASANAQAGKVSWDFEQLCLDKQPNEAKFNELLAMPRANSAQRWVIVEPPPRASNVAPSNAEAFKARASEFVRRLIAAKVSGANAIIVPKPFNDENGLMRADGMPAELLLPWRTTAAMLGGAQYLGQMQLPSGSENRIFLRGDGQMVMVVWNSQQAQEVLYLGVHVQQIDLLGRSTAVAMQGHEQVIKVGPTPTFVLGLHEAITRWRMSAQFEKRQVPSDSSKSHHNSLHFKNFFPQGVGGSVKIVVLQDRGVSEAAGGPEGAALSGFAPERWMIEPPQSTFQLAADADTKFPFDIKLKNALYGKQPVRVDFKVEADEQLEFSVYRDMEVGTEDLTLDVKSHVDKDGTLLVEQMMTNSAAQLADFKCSLQAKGHRPQRMQVYRLGKNLDRKVYRIPDGRSLVGKEMLLELEELNGPRILKYRFVAAATTESSAEAGASTGAGSAEATKAGQSPAVDAHDKNSPPAESGDTHPPPASIRS